MAVLLLTVTIVQSGPAGNCLQPARNPRDRSPVPSWPSAAHHSSEINIPPGACLKDRDLPECSHGQVPVESQFLAPCGHEELPADFAVTGFTHHNPDCQSMECKAVQSCLAGLVSIVVTRGRVPRSLVPGFGEGVRSRLCTPVVRWPKRAVCPHA